MDRYLDALYAIVTSGRNTNSYKFALWRALARLAPDTQERNPVISKQQLSPLFLEYYWPLEVKYHIRQGIDPDKDPIVMVLIRKLVRAGKIAQGETLTHFQRRNPEEYQTLHARVAQEAFDDVIPRFHTVHGEKIDLKFFTFTGQAGKVAANITLTSGGRRFLIDHRKLVDHVAISGWVRFSERFTSAPRLHDKIAGHLKRGAVSKWCHSLMKIHNGRCFYDENHDMAAPEVDHVLPWTFVAEDKTWNLVLSCRKCNNEKRDKLTSAETLELLCRRNDQILTGETHVDDVFFRHFAEWHLRDLRSHIKTLYRDAAAANFPMWHRKSC